MNEETWADGQSSVTTQIDALRAEVTSLAAESMDYERLAAARAALAPEPPPEADWWEELPAERQARILEGMAQARRGETVSAEEARARLMPKQRA